MPDSNKNYTQVLAELDQWGSYESSAQTRDISKLDGIRRLLGDLENPEKNFKIIHVAGTNGKGLTAAMISKLLEVQGFSSGCYTSPHLVDIRERITLNGRFVSESEFARSASRVLRLAKDYKGTPYLSYFDILTAVAFNVFLNCKMDWVVLETGLGGRADSTNVTDKELCILTRIGLDHQEVLGNSLKQIASEKTGITRTGTPVIVAPQVKELKTWLMEKFSKDNVPCIFVDEIFDREFADQKLSPSIYTKPWIECFQTSLSAMQVLFKANSKLKQNWFNAAQKVKLPGRLDLRHNVLWSKNKKNFKTLLTDGGHNQDALLALSEFISNNNLSPCTLILAMASDKLHDSLRDPLKKLCRNADLIILTSVHSPRSATPELLESFLNNSGAMEHSPEIKLTASAEDALEMSLSSPETPVVAAGSFYLVGLVMTLLGINTNSTN
jgi:dihydrofolate synthase/folylpolyglutamate synthase